MSRAARQMVSASLFAGLLLLVCETAEAQNLLPDPSFEKPIDRNRWGHVFGEWGGNVYEGNPSFEVGRVARTGKHSCEIVGAVGGKIRIGSKPTRFQPGRYRVTAYLRGLDIGKGRWGRTIDFSMLFDEMMDLKAGTDRGRKVDSEADRAKLAAAIESLLK